MSLTYPDLLKSIDFVLDGLTDNWLASNQSVIVLRSKLTCLCIVFGSFLPMWY